MWLERMNHAIVMLNYEGTFFHLRNGRVETLHITHRVEGRKVTERLVSLDGNGREIIRSEGEQFCFLPDQRRVLVQTIRKARSGLLGAPLFCRNVELHYTLQMLEPARVSGRPTRVIAVNPKDNYRFGYRLWLDEETALPLKTQLRDSGGGVIEQILFAKLTLPAHIDKAAVQPRVDSEGFQWIRNPASPEDAGSQPAWRAQKLPPGFKLTDASTRMLEGARQSGTHLVYSDGLASVSVFIEASGVDRKAMKGPSRVGSSFAFSTLVQGHQVTAVGEVPVQTVRLIAASIRPETASVAER
jgi:sigma-E factor negative regulatory protein RseB